MYCFTFPFWKFYTVSPKEQKSRIKKLFSICCNLPKLPESVTTEEEVELRDILGFLSRANKNRKISDEEKKLLQTTSQLTTTITVLLKEMRSIENDRSNYQLTQKNKSADGLVFNVVTQDMINKSTKPYRGHRFTKENVLNTRKLVCKEHREPISRYQGPRESNEEYQFISHSNQKLGFE